MAIARQQRRVAPSRKPVIRRVTPRGAAAVRRTVWLKEQDAPAFEAIGEHVERADVKREGMAATSFDVALGQ